MASATSSHASPDPFDLGVHTPPNLARLARASQLRHSSPIASRPIGLTSAFRRPAATPSSPLIRLSNAAATEGAQRESTPNRPGSAESVNLQPVSIVEAANKLAVEQTNAYNAKMTVFAEQFSNSFLDFWKQALSDLNSAPAPTYSSVAAGRPASQPSGPHSTAAAAPQQQRPQQPTSRPQEPPTPAPPKEDRVFVRLDAEAPARDHSSYAIRTHIAAKVGIDLHRVPAAFKVNPGWAIRTTDATIRDLIVQRQSEWSEDLDATSVEISHKWYTYVVPNCPRRLTDLQGNEVNYEAAVKDEIACQTGLTPISIRPSRHDSSDLPTLEQCANCLGPHSADFSKCPARPKRSHGVIRRLTKEEKPSSDRWAPNYLLSGSNTPSTAQPDDQEAEHPDDRSRGRSETSVLSSTRTMSPPFIMRRPVATRDILWLTINNITVVNFYRQPHYDEALEMLLQWTTPGSLLNPADVPTNPHGNTIDLAFSNIPLSEAVVEEHLATSSDHFTLSVTLADLAPASVPLGKVRLTSDDELARFAEMVDSGATAIPAAASSPKSLIPGVGARGTSPTGSQGRRSPCPQRARSAPWWTEECALAAAEYRAIRRVYPLGFNREVQLAKRLPESPVRWLRSPGAFQPPPLQASLEEVRDATLRTGNTSPGPDSITVQMLKARSAVDLVAALLHDIEEAFARGQVATLVTMDIQGAFDTVLRNRLILRLHDTGIWLDSTLSFKTHVEKWTAKAQVVAYHLKSLANTKHGPLPGAVRRAQAANSPPRRFGDDQALPLQTAPKDQSAADFRIWLRGMPADSSQDVFLEFQALATAHGATEVRWIPGHTSIPGNEQADALAKAGTSQPEPAGAVPTLAYLRRAAGSSLNSQSRNRQRLRQVRQAGEGVLLLEWACPRH
ncbi:acid phosphatase domain-containing protein [Hirsutella rhossiliensis]